MGTFTLSTPSFVYIHFFTANTQSICIQQRCILRVKKGGAELAFHAYYVFKVELCFCKMLCFVAVIK